MHLVRAHLLIPAILIALAAEPPPARTQESGDVAKGHAVARDQCAGCHAVQKGQAGSPSSGTPAFATIAAVPGMTAMALHASLQSAHRAMPNIMLAPEDQWNIVAYILSLN